MPYLKISLFLMAAGIFMSLASDDVQAQGPIRTVIKDVHEFKRDYKKDRGFTYQPGDPWYRSKVFRMHTGHWGRYYNCDCEESKRNSPYIDWQQHCEPDFPKHKGLFRCLAADLERAKQRVRDGACCESCDRSERATDCAHCSERNCTVCQKEVENAEPILNRMAKVPANKVPAAKLPVKDSGLLNR